MGSAGRCFSSVYGASARVLWSGFGGCLPRRLGSLCAWESGAGRQLGPQLLFLWLLLRPPWASSQHGSAPGALVKAARSLTGWPGELSRITSAPSDQADKFPKSVQPPWPWHLSRQGSVRIPRIFWGVCFGTHKTIVTQIENKTVFL